MHDAPRLTTHPPRSGAPLSSQPIPRGSLIFVYALGFAAACSSQPGSSGGGETLGGGSPSGGAAGAQTPTAGANAVGGDSAFPMTAGASATGGASSAAGSASGGASGGAAASGGAGGAQCRSGVPETEWEANCIACAGGTDCAQCACVKCAQPVRACETTPGCSDIAACVRASACTGTACYCGTASLLDCANGGGNGPCKAAMLAAPGGKAPTAVDPSAGPASDALLAVNKCMQDPNSCGPSCN